MNYFRDLEEPPEDVCECPICSNPPSDCMCYDEEPEEREATEEDYDKAEDNLLDR